MDGEEGKERNGEKRKEGGRKEDKGRKGPTEDLTQGPATARAGPVRVNDLNFVQLPVGSKFILLILL
jgi:hypothetical protein